MKTRLFLALAAFVLSFGIAEMAPAAPPSSCEQFCWTVRCLPTAPVCGPYINAAGNPACGCHASGPKG